MGTFLLTEAHGLFTLSAKQPAGWRVAYVFDLEPQIQSDYDVGNWYTSTSPDAPFLDLLIMERVSSNGATSWPIAGSRSKHATARLFISAPSDVPMNSVSFSKRPST